MANKDLFHSDGNSTVKLPKEVQVKNRTGNDTYNEPGKLLPTKKVIQKGWNK